jgi:arginine/ornithine N-succinyltransferase beta subunit
MSLTSGVFSCEFDSVIITAAADVGFQRPWYDSRICVFVRASHHEGNKAVREM